MIRLNYLCLYKIRLDHVFCSVYSREMLNRGQNTEVAQWGRKLAPPAALLLVVIGLLEEKGSNDSWTFKEDERKLIINLNGQGTLFQMD